MYKDPEKRKAAAREAMRKRRSVAQVVGGTLEGPSMEVARRRIAEALTPEFERIYKALEAKHLEHEVRLGIGGPTVGELWAMTKKKGPEGP